MARKDLEPAERDRVPLTIEELVECPRCFTLFDEVFQAPDGVFETEDLEDPITKLTTCPACGHEFIATFDGWIVHGDAG